MKKRQGSLFDDVHAPNMGAVMPDNFDPFNGFVAKGMKAQQAADKLTKRPRKAPKQNLPPLHLAPKSSEPGAKQIIYGTIPSKSNCYVIITMKPKKNAAPKYVECDSCNGSGWVVIDGRVKCGFCDGSGLIKKEQKGHASLAKSSALKKYEDDFFIQCNQYRNAMIDGYFQVEVDVYYPNQRSDLDNSLKVLLDCLQKIRAFKNDNKCTRIVANKFLDPVNPRIEFTIKTSL